MFNSRSERPSSSPRSKRRRDSTDKDRLTNRTPSPLPFSKKTNMLFRSAAEKNTAFWENLSKVILCESYLNEVDRRAPLVCRIAIRAQPPSLRTGEITEPSAELQRACRVGGLDLGHLRGYATRKTASAPSTEMPLMGTGNPLFGQHLADHRIFPHANLTTMPGNWREISDMIKQVRPVPIPSESYATLYQEFCRVILDIINEQDVKRKIFPLLEGIEGRNDFYSSGDYKFSNLEDLTDGSVAKPSPDVYDGEYPHKIEPEILKELSCFISPRGATKNPVVPNFFAELKSPESSPNIAEPQARYAGASGARAIHELRTFLTEDPDEIFDNNAYVITATYFMQMLRLYAHHPVKPSVPSDSITYRMTLICAFAMDGGAYPFLQAVVAFRNAREWAKKKRVEFIAEANARKRNLANT